MDVGHSSPCKWSSRAWRRHAMVGRGRWRPLVSYVKMRDALSMHCGRTLIRSSHQFPSHLHRPPMPTKAVRRPCHNQHDPQRGRSLPGRRSILLHSILVDKCSERRRSARAEIFPCWTGGWCQRTDVRFHVKRSHDHCRGVEYLGTMRTYFQYGAGIVHASKSVLAASSCTLHYNAGWFGGHKS
jgi:hypothetical protein